MTKSRKKSLEIKGALRGLNSVLIILSTFLLNEHRPSCHVRLVQISDFDALVSEFIESIALCLSLIILRLIQFCVLPFSEMIPDRGNFIRHPSLDPIYALSICGCLSLFLLSIQRVYEHVNLISLSTFILIVPSIHSLCY